MVIGVVLLGNAPYLLHLFDPNPIDTLSTLQTTQTNGLTPGLFYTDPNIGQTAQALGHRAALDLLHFHLPWWNQFEGVGTPLAGEMQSAALFPATLLLALSNGQLYFHILLELTAGVGTYLLCQKLKFSRPASVVAAGAFALNGTFAWLSHAPENPIAFLPLLILGIELCRESPARARGSVLIGIALALSIYAGFPETAYLDGLLVVIWTAVRAVSLRESHWKAYLIRVGYGVGTGLLLAAPILVAFADYLRHAYVGGHGGVFAHYTEPGSSLPPVLLPYVYGPIFAWYGRDPQGPITVFWDNAGGFFTAALCALAIVGCFVRRERLLRLALVAWVLAGLARTFGIPPFLSLFNLIPGVKETAFFRYAPPSWELSLIVLASFGLDEVVAGRSRVKLLCSSTVVLLAVLWAYRAAQPALRTVAGAPHNHAWSLAAATWAALVVGAICVVAVIRSRKPRAFLLGSVVLLDVVAMFLVPVFAAPRRVRLDYGPIHFLTANLGTSRIFTLGPLSPDYGSYYGIASAAVNDLPTPKLFASYITQNLNSNADPVSFNGTAEADWSGPTYAEEFLAHLDAYRNLGIKYVLVPAGMKLGPAPDGTQFPPVYSDPTVQILYVPGSAPFYQGSGCTFSEVTSNSAVVHCNQATTLVRRELYMPGWTASLNGHGIPIQLSGDLFEKVAVPRGNSTLTFSFQPPHTGLAFAAFGTGLVALVVMLVPTFRRRNTGRNGPVRPSKPKAVAEVGG